jgi:hypothetical protein
MDISRWPTIQFQNEPEIINYEEDKPIGGQKNELLK